MYSSTYCIQSHQHHLLPTTTSPCLIRQQRHICQKFYVGQSGHSIAVRYQQHIQYIRTNSSHSAYAMHILNNQHEYGPSEYTLHMLQPCHKGTLMNIWENFFIQQLHHLQLLINEQSPQEPNPLYTLGRIPQQLATPSEP
jgi:hypothetical protein